LIEDLAVVGESLALALATTACMEVRCCSSIKEGIELLSGSSGQFDVVLLKQRSGDEQADELLSIAGQNGLKGRVLIITPWLSELEHRHLASLGVAGIFAKQRSLVDLICAIREVAGGQTWFDELPSNGGSSNGTLSGQERRAAELVLEGLANKEIGVRMAVSESCIKALLQRAFLKLGVHNRSQLVRALMEKSIGAQPRSDGVMQLPRSMGHLGTREAAHRDLSVSS
jgi:DNA-binding NarL/FixJ family response regulator